MDYANNPNINPVPVYFAQIPENMQGSKYEPQRVRVLENSSAFIQINNRDRLRGDNPFDFSINLSTYVQNVRRVALNALVCSQPCGNVHRKNNTLQISILAGPDAGLHTFTIVPGYYTAVTLAAAINAAMAAVPGLLLTYNVDTRKFTITYAFLFFIVPTCSAIIFGYSCYGFISSSVPALSITSELVGLVGIQTLFVKCPQMVLYQKNNATSSDPKIGDYFAVIEITGNVLFENSISYFPSILVYKNFEPQTQITALTFRFVDQDGDDPFLYTDSPETWRCNIEIITLV
jgi:hypothetical protein